MKSTILIIDDDKLMSILLENMLSDKYELIHVFTAQSGINILSKKKIDLVLADIHMPGMSGLQFLESVMADSNKNKIPVIILTGRHSAEKKKRAINLGAVDFIKKELLVNDENEFIKRIELALLENIVSYHPNDKLNFDQKKLAQLLISEAKNGNFISSSKKLLLEIKKTFGLFYISFWTISDNKAKLVLYLENQNTNFQPPEYGGEELKGEKRFQELLMDKQTYFSNHAFDRTGKKREGFLSNKSRKNNLPAEIAIPIFDIGPRTLSKIDYEIPESASLFGLIIVKHNKLFSEEEFRIIERVFMQTGAVLWRLYKKI